MNALEKHSSPLDALRVVYARVSNQVQAFGPTMYTASLLGIIPT